MTRRRLAAACLLVALVAGLAAGFGAKVPSTSLARISVDEPQYVLSAISLAEDGDLDIGDELRDGRWRAWSDVPIQVQTQALPDGRAISPHDPLLPLLLAPFVGVFGWAGAKVTMVLLAMVTAAVALWVADRRLGLSPWLGVPGVLAGVTSAPLAVYGQQVYPELPAALAVLVAYAAGTGRLRRRGLLVLLIAVVSMPWLGVKYAPVAAALLVVPALRLARSRRWWPLAALATGLVAAAGAYLAVHRWVWGGWTVYASGDHFTQTGEFSVVGVSPDYLGRSLRLTGLFVDRDYGLVPWAPVWLLLPVAVGAGLRRHDWAVLLPLAAGWATAVWVALTMHGFWWPGRQLVVVLPLAGLLLLSTLSRGPRVLRRGAVGLCALGTLAYVALLVDGLQGRITWVVGFAHVREPVYRAMRPLLPDYRGSSVWPGYWPAHVGWTAVLLVLMCVGWRTGVDRSHERRAEKGRPRDLEVARR